jgi:hypothetical protein
VPPTISPPAQRLLAELADLVAEPVPHDLVAALQALPEPGALPSPWDTWTAIGLCRHQARQAWLLKVVRDRLFVDPAALARGGAFAHPSALPDHGPVPGLAQWHYMFHGTGCCLVHEASGEAIDVDFEDGTPDHFDTYFYVGYIRSLRAPDVPEARLQALCPDGELLAHATFALQDAGVLLRGDHRVHFRLSAALQAAHGAVDALARALADESRRCWLAARLGDWPWAHELAPPELRPHLAARADRTRALRREYLERALVTGDHHDQMVALRGLAALEIPDLDDHLVAALDGPPSGLVGTALELLEPRWHQGHADPVYALLKRLDPRGEIPAPYLFSTSAALLLTQGAHVEAVLDRIAAIGPHAGARLLTLALAFRAPSAITLVREALRSPVALDRNEAAALLASLDLPWTRRELRSVLSESHDLIATSECRAALRRSDDPAARAAVDAWDRLHPFTPREEPPYTWLDIQISNCDDFLADAIDDLADLINNYRDRLTDPDRTQWS